MKIFLSALEASGEFEEIDRRIQEYKWNLMSFFYLKSNMNRYSRIVQKSELIMIDSGAHSFQKGKKVDWEKYTLEYAEFIKKYDLPKIIGYFEMDVDNIIGYEKVLELRRILERVSDKIIPVWHKNRGIQDYIDMCQKYQNKIIAITGFKNEDIQDHQYIDFLKVAKKYNCKVHCLGMTRRKILDKVPFDYVDSSSWKQAGIYGKIGNKKVSREFSKVNRPYVMFLSYLEGMKMQEEYYNKWRKMYK